MSPAPETETDTPGSGDQPQEDPGVEVQTKPSNASDDLADGRAEGTRTSGGKEPSQ